MNRGYIKVWRKLEDSGLLQVPNTLALFMFLLMHATHKDIKVGTKTGVVQLKRGQYISGIRKLAEELEQTFQTIRTALDRLVSLEIVTIKSTNKYSVYTIVNYDFYQDNNTEETCAATNKQQTDNKQTTHKQECKELKNVKNKYIPPIPADLLSDFMTVRKAKRVGIVTERVFKSIESEAKKISWTPEQAIDHCVKKGWASFEAGWVKTAGDDLPFGRDCE